jgi:hypothetical protein
MTYEGMLLKHGENENCTINARIRGFWFNKTDGNWYCLMSGSSIHKGTRTHAYLAISEDLNFTGDFNNLLYYREEWEEGSWADKGVYPPDLVWLNDRGFGAVKGYANPARPYDFDADLLFTDSPKNISKDSFLNNLDSRDAYFSKTFGLIDAQRSIPVLQNGILWMMVRNGIREQGTKGNIFQMTGYWANETVTISPGYTPLYHYDNLPTKEEFNAMMDITVYVWAHEAQVTVNHIKGEKPTYAKLQIEGTSGDEVIIHFNELTTETVYLHVNKENDVNIITLNDLEAGSEQKLIPDNTGDILFSYIIK